jgi:uncharacterized protein
MAVMPEKRVCEWVAADPLRMRALNRARDLDLPDWCIGAGFVRNLVWDRLHRFATPTALNDIDLIYFDSVHPDAQRDQDLQADLHRRDGDLAWSVHNQARMHVRNGDPPYLSTNDAMSYWVEVETAVGIRLDHSGKLHVVSPFGLDSLFAKAVTPNGKRSRPDEFISRMTQKKWLEIWPELQVRL